MDSGENTREDDIDQFLFCCSSPQISEWHAAFMGSCSLSAHGNSIDGWLDGLDGLFSRRTARAGDLVSFFAWEWSTEMAYLASSWLPSPPPLGNLWAGRVPPRGVFKSIDTIK